MIYIASPYSSSDLTLVEQRYRRVCFFVEHLIDRNYVAFSPIVYCHPFAMRLNLSADALTWAAFNVSMLRRADAMFVLKLPGWAESRGVKSEITLCKLINIPITFFEPEIETWPK